MSDQESPSYPGTPLARGPMGGNQYTQIHNHVFRDARMSAKAKGIFGFLSTHAEGWRTDAKAIARAMKDGRDAIQSGLQELERHHYLIRHQPRNADGTVGKPVWFYTDLPAQILALGITDESVVVDRVQEAFKEWMATQVQTGRSGPETENPSTAPTSENADAADAAAHADQNPVDNATDPARSPRSVPETGFPEPAEPDTANPPHKKNNNQKTNRENTNQGGACPPCPPNPAAVAAGPNTNRNRTTKKDSKRKTRSNPLTAHARKMRARELAGPAAVAAIAAEPTISVEDLVDVLARSNPRLTHVQAVSRATQLIAWENAAAERGQVPA